MKALGAVFVLNITIAMPLSSPPDPSFAGAYLLHPEVSPSYAPIVSRHVFL